jgi:hypothetical protein
MSHRGQTVARPMTDQEVWEHALECERSNAARRERAEREAWLAAQSGWLRWSQLTAGQVNMCSSNPAQA